MKLFLAVLLMSPVFSSVSSLASEPKILIEQDPTLLTSTVQVVVRAGSEEDANGKNGTTNMLAELMLRGTKKRTRSQFQNEIERMGASLSVSASHDMIVLTVT